VDILSHTHYKLKGRLIERNKVNRSNFDAFFKSTVRHNDVTLTAFCSDRSYIASRYDAIKVGSL